MFVEFCHRMLNCECHNEHYEKHFYHSFIGRGHCVNDCDICFEKGLNIIQHNLDILESYRKLAMESNDNLRSFFHDNIQSGDSCQLLSAVYEHVYSTTCCPNIHFRSNLNSINYQNLQSYAYYINLDKDQCRMLCIGNIISFVMKFMNVLVILHLKMKNIYILC